MITDTGNRLQAKIAVALSIVLTQVQVVLLNPPHFESPTRRLRQAMSNFRTPHAILVFDYTLSSITDCPDMCGSSVTLSVLAL